MENVKIIAESKKVKKAVYSISKFIIRLYNCIEVHMVLVDDRHTTQQFDIHVHLKIDNKLLSIRVYVCIHTCGHMYCVVRKEQFCTVDSRE